MWTLFAGLVGVAASLLFSGLLHWPRSTFVLAYGVLVAAFLVLFVRGLQLRLSDQFKRHWPAGLVAGVLVGLLLARNVYDQPASPRPAGGDLIAALVWYGVVYGAIDATLLTIVPVLSLYGSRPPADLQRAAGRFRWGLVAVLGSLLVTALYHLGFAQFRGSGLLGPLIGNALITMAYLLTGNPLAAVASHVIMHCAAVWHGMATTLQLPPHY
jgi:hypothetical protein